MNRTLVGWALALLMVFGGLVTTSCQDPFKVTTNQEIKIGRESRKELEHQYGVWHNDIQTARIKRIGLRIAKDTSRPDLPWSFEALDTREINALAAPGGFIFVTRGLLEHVADDDELAGVLGHEVTHVVRRHSAKMIEKESKIALAAGVLLHNESDAVVLGANIAHSLVMSGYSRKDEYEADKYGTIFASQAGYAKDGLLRFLRWLEQQEKHKPSSLERWMATHPPTKDRIKRLEKQLGLR